MNTTICAADFRAAMDLPLTLSNEAQLRAALQTLINELLAEPCRRRDPKLQSMLIACRLRLRAMQNLIAATQQEQDMALWRCDIRSLLEDLCAAADLLLSPLGRSVSFNAPPELIEAACSPRDISWLVLELICNAARHTHGEEITVAMSLKKPRTRRKAMACVVTVESAGEIDLTRLHASAAKEGSGASVVLRTAWLHHGALFWLGRDGNAVAALRMPLQKPAGLPEWEPADLVELLSDQCSQVYIALAQVTGS